MTNIPLEQAKRQLDAALRGLSDTDSAPQATAMSSAPPDPLLTLTRLLVGAGLLGMDELARRAPEWERQAALDSIPPTEAAAAHSAATVTDPAAICESLLESAGRPGSGVRGPVNKFRAQPAVVPQAVPRPILAS